MTGNDRQAVLRLTGELEDPDAVRAAIADASWTFTLPLRIDLTSVTYLPSVILGVLFGAMKAADAAGIDLEVAAAAGTVVHQILLVTALPHITV